jgi:hypothetical protein
MVGGTGRLGMLSSPRSTFRKVAGRSGSNPIPPSIRRIGRPRSSRSSMMVWRGPAGRRIRWTSRRRNPSNQLVWLATRRRGSEGSRCSGAGSPPVWIPARRVRSQGRKATSKRRQALGDPEKVMGSVGGRRGERPWTDRGWGGTLRRFRLAGVPRAPPSTSASCPWGGSPQPLLHVRPGAMDPSCRGSPEDDRGTGDPILHPSSIVPCLTP